MNMNKPTVEDFLEWAKTQPVTLEELQRVATTITPLLGALAAILVEKGVCTAEEIEKQKIKSTALSDQLFQKKLHEGIKEALEEATNE